MICLKCKPLLLLILIICSGISIQGQQAYIDSLYTLLEKPLDNETKMDVYLKLAKSYRNLNPYFGLDYVDSCLALVHKTGNELMEAMVINETGVLYRKVDMYDEAIKKHQEALSKFEILDNKMGKAYALANLGNVFLILGQLQKALDYNQQSLVLKKQIGDPLQIAYSTRTTGLVFQAMKQYDSAAVYYSL